MTGYGKSSAIYQNKKITVEIKSLNSKSFDLFVRIPSIYKEKELEIRQIISTYLDRGKVEFTINIEQLGTKKSVEINKELEDKPELVNSEPFTDGWIAKIKISDKSQLDSLMSAEEYEKMIKTCKPI